MIQLKGAGQNFSLVLASKCFGFLEGQRIPRLVEFAAGVFLKLHAKRRDNIEGCVKFRNLLQNSDHAPVVFYGVQARPREDVPPTFGVAILRLVHVPEHYEVNARHRHIPERVADSEA